MDKGRAECVRLHRRVLASGLLAVFAWTATGLPGIPVSFFGLKASAMTAPGTASIVGKTASTMSAPDNPIPIISGIEEVDPEDALANTQQQETDLLTQLRALQLDIARKRTEADDLRLEMAALDRQLQALDRQWEEEHQRYGRNQKLLGEVLAAWQTAGVGSRLELLLSSDSLTLFLQRLSALQQLDRDTEGLLARMDENLQRMTTHRAVQQETRDALDRKASTLQEALHELLDKEIALETSLEGLRSDRARYEALLAELAETWEKSLDIFPDLTEAFTRIIAEGQFPEDALDMRFGLGGITAVMREDRFAEILGNATGLPPLTFSFENDAVRLEVPEAELDVRGRFDIRDGVTLVFVPLSGAQGGLALREEQLADLSGKGPLAFRLEPILMGTTLRKVTPEPEQLVLTLSMGLF